MGSAELQQIEFVCAIMGKEEEDIFKMDKFLLVEIRIYVSDFNA